MNLRDGLLTMVGAPNFETTLGIAGLHFEIGTFPGAAPDQFDLASGAATPGTGNGVVGRTMTRQRVSDAVGCPKSAASAGRRQRRMAMPMVPEPSGARLKAAGGRHGEPRDFGDDSARPPCRKPSSKQMRTDFSSPAST
jgi:hypothetical protein